MKRALIVANLAGFASFLLNDIDILQDMGYQVFFAANANKLAWNDTKQQLDQRNVAFLQVDFDSKKPISLQNGKAFRQIRRILKEEHFDLIHCHTPIAGMIVRLAASGHRKKGTKVIYTTHGLAFTSNSSWKSKLVYKNMEDFCSGLCDAIITINREDYDNTKQMHCAKVYYIHGVGVDTQKYVNAIVDREAYRSSLGVANDEIMVLSVGELSERKNHQIIIDALSRIHSTKKYVYVICGNGIDGGTGPQLIQMAKEKGVRLLLLGFRFDIPQITKCSDIGAIPSVREGLGLAGVQSLAAGVPVVGTDVQGIRDYIDNGNTGFLCGAFDAEAYAIAIETLASMKPDERQRMEDCCVEMSRSFDLHISKQEMKAIYYEIL